MINFAWNLNLRDCLQLKGAIDLPAVERGFGNICGWWVLTNVTEFNGIAWLNTAFFLKSLLPILSISNVWYFGNINKLIYEYKKITTNTRLKNGGRYSKAQLHVQFVDLQCFNRQFECTSASTRFLSLMTYLLLINELSGVFSISDFSRSWTHLKSENLKSRRFLVDLIPKISLSIWAR